MDKKESIEVQIDEIRQNEMALHANALQDSDAFDVSVWESPPSDDEMDALEKELDEMKFNADIAFTEADIEDEFDIPNKNTEED